MSQYLNRAEYIKKTVLDKPAPEQSDGGTAMKKKAKDQDDKEDEEEKKM